MKITTQNIDWLLRDWGYEVTLKLESSGYPAQAGLSEVIGSHVFSSKIPLDDSWRHPESARIDAAMKVVGQYHSNMIIYRRILKYTYRQIGEDIGIPKSTVKDHMDRAEDLLISLL